MKALRAMTLATGLAALSVTGCVTNGDDFPSDLTWIKEGVTKKSDVKSILGEPYSVGSSSGRPAWTYGYYRYKLIGKSTQKELKFYWNPDETVSSYSFTSSFPEDITRQPGASKPAAPDQKSDGF
jgi:hypothetical protein